MIVGKKARKTFSFLVVLSFLLGSVLISPAGNTKNVLAASKTVNSLKVKKSKVTIDQDDIKYISYKVNANKGASKKVTAKSSNKKVASIDYIDNKEIGIYGNKPGTATITVTTKAKNANGKRLSKKIKVSVIGDSSYYTKKLKKHIENNGYTNKNYDMGIKNIVDTDAVTMQTAIIDETDTNGYYSFLFMYSDNENNSLSTLTLNVPLPERNASIELSYFSVNSVIPITLSNDFNVNIASIKSKNHFDLFDDKAENDLGNSLLNLACSSWDLLLFQELGFGLYELGFKKYK